MRISQATAIVEASIDSQIKYATGRDAQRPIPYLVGGAGLGKTTTVTTLSDGKEGWAHYILSLAQYDAGDIMGVIAMDNGKAVRLKPHWLSSVEELADTNKVVVLFLDELPQAPVSNQNVSAQLVNERRVGEFKLPDNVVLVAAGNRTSDRAGTNNMPSHLKDRLLFLEVEADLEDTIAYYNSVGVSPLVTGFLRFRPELLHKFDRDANSCPSPRSWERVDTMMKWDIDPVNRQEAVAGQVGQGACAEFFGYKAVHDAVPDIDAVIANPDSAPVAEDPAVCYAVSAALAHRANDKNIGSILKYMDRLPHKEFAVFTVKDAINRHPDIKKTDAFRQFLLSRGKELML
jgi:hypothetical protein